MPMIAEECLSESRHHRAVSVVPTRVTICVPLLRLFCDCTVGREMACHQKDLARVIIIFFPALYGLFL